MWHISLTSPKVRALCDRAGECGAFARPRSVDVGASLNATDVLVHDFLPDARTSCAWLDKLAIAGQTPVVIALLDVPASPVLHILSQSDRQFVCADIALVAESTPATLAKSILDAASFADQHGVAKVLSTVWTDDPVLLTIARAALHMNRGGDESRLTRVHVWPNESQLLPIARISRGAFVRHAHRAGFRPALRFLHVVRVLAVSQALHTGRGTIDRIAGRFGYSSTGTLRRHFRALTGFSPREARLTSLPELANTIHRRLAARPMLNNDSATPR